MSAKTNVFACQLWKVDVIRWNKMLLFEISFCVHIWQETANIGFAFQHHVTPGRTKSGKSSIRMKTILKLRFCWHAGTQQRHPHEILWHSRCWDKPPDKTAEIWKTQNRLVWTNMVTFHLQKLQGMPGMPPEFSFLYGFHACPVWINTSPHSHGRASKTLSFTELTTCRTVMVWRWQQQAFCPTLACEIGHWLTKNHNNEIATKKSEHYLYCLLTTACQIKMWNCNMQDTPWGQITHATGSDCATTLSSTQVWNCSHGTSKSKVPARLLWTTSPNPQSTGRAGNILGWSARSEPCLRLLATASCLL